MEENNKLSETTQDNVTQVETSIQENEPKKKGKKKWVMALLLLLTFSSVSVAVWAIFFKEKPKAATPKPEATQGPSILEPDRVPENKEENAESMGDQGDKKLDHPEGGGAVSITYSKDVTIDLSDKNVTLLFGNPSRSTQDMVVQIVIQDTIIVQSDTLAPGFQVKKLALDDGSKLKAGSYSGKFKILYFNPATGEKAVVNTEIPIDIEVKE